MIAPLDWQPEPFSATGGMAADGIKNQLGRPRMDPLEVLVREAVQNSWDARANDIGGIVFGLSCWTATRDQTACLRDTVLLNNAPLLAHAETLSNPPLSLLAVYDRGTIGLEGPTRADCAPAPGERTNFVDFLRALGQPRIHQYGGGTYGYGKAAFYTSSRVRTICVYTRCQTADRMESRFMSAALGPQFIDGERRFTGRHWWGRRNVDGVVDPLTGAEADEIASGLGLTPFSVDETGSTILIIQPEFGGRTASAAMGLMRMAILRYLWPKMVDGPTGGSTIEFEMLLEGEQFPIPRPESVPALHGFIDAFASLRASDNGTAPYGVQLDRIDSLRPPRHLGRMALVRFPPRQHRTEQADEDEQTAVADDPLVGGSHHTALMRAPNFVVRYIPGPPVPFNHAEYSGVFISDRAVDAVFAEAEPPTHDDWVPEGLSEAGHKTFIRTALRRVKESMTRFAAPPVAKNVAGKDVPLGSFSDQLGGLVAAEAGTGAGIRGFSGAGGDPPPGAGQAETALGFRGGIGSGFGAGEVAVAAAQGPDRTELGGQDAAGEGGNAEDSGGIPRDLGRIAIADDGRIELVRGVPALVLDFDVIHSGSRGTVVAVAADVVIDGGSIETEPPAGSEQPRILEWRGPGGVVVEGVQECIIAPGSLGRWSVAVSVPSDAMIAVTLRTVPLRAA